jgi:hypothetical protein
LSAVGPTSGDAVGFTIENLPPSKIHLGINIQQICNPNRVIGSCHILDDLLEVATSGRGARGGNAAV